MDRCRIVWLNGINAKQILQGAYVKQQIDRIKLNPMNESIIEFKD